MDNKILDKVRKLLKLSDSPNEHEAAAALRRAQALMDRYRISESELAASDIEVAIDPEPMEASTRQVPPWKQALCVAVAQSNRCEALLTGRADTRVVVVGSPTDTAVARVMYDFVKDCILRMSLADARREASRLGRKSMRPLWIESWRMGAAAHLEARLLQVARKNRMLSGGQALARRQDAVRDFLRDSFELGEAEAVSAGMVSQGAFERGALYGRTMPTRPEESH